MSPNQSPSSDQIVISNIAFFDLGPLVWETLVSTNWFHPGTEVEMTSVKI